MVQIIQGLYVLCLLGMKKVEPFCNHYLHAVTKGATIRFPGGGWSFF